MFPEWRRGQLLRLLIDANGTCSRLIPQDTMRRLRRREPASARATASGDREELLPPLDTQQGTEIPAGAKTLWDGGVASTYKVPWSTYSETLFVYSLASIVATYISSAGGADSSYFAQAIAGSSPAAEISLCVA